MRHTAVPCVSQLPRKFWFWLNFMLLSDRVRINSVITKTSCLKSVCADANLKFELDISIDFRDMIKETDSEGMNCCLPPVSEFLKSFNFCQNLCFKVTLFKSTKISQILTLAQVVGPFNADVNLKYELCIFNNKRDISKRRHPLVVHCCHTTSG